jgi:hypothetical protein
MPDSAPKSWSALTLRLAGRAALNPRLALDLVRTAWAFRRRSWWRTPPWLPLPDREYLRWRMYTAYGDENAVPPLGDVIGFARWRRETMRL